MPGLIAHARADSTSDGVVTVKSDYPVAETVSRIKRDVAKKGIMFFGVIDQAKLGNAAGNQVLPSRLVMFGNPALGTTFVTANQKAGLDWPVGVLVYQEADGGVYAAYTDFGWIASVTASRAATRNSPWRRKSSGRSRQQCTNSAHRGPARRTLPTPRFLPDLGRVGRPATCTNTHFRERVGRRPLSSLQRGTTVFRRRVIRLEVGNWSPRRQR